MNFLIDAQLPPALTHWIVSRGHQATHVIDLGFHATDDPTVWERARKEKWDFIDRWLLSDQPIGLIWIRKGNCSNRALIAWLEPLWPGVVKRLEQGEKLIELRA